MTVPGPCHHVDLQSKALSTSYLLCLQFCIKLSLTFIFCLRHLPLNISETHSFCFSFHCKRYEYTIQGLSIIYKWAFVLFLFMGPIVVVAVDILMDICIHLPWWL